MKIYTLIKRDNLFIPLSEWIGPFADINYIEGAIVIEVNEEKIIDEKLWDDVNHLWPYIVNELPTFVSTHEMKVGFPDQPIDFSVSNIKNGWVKLTVSSSSEVYANRKLPFDDFLTELISAARYYFTRCEELHPGCEPSTDYYLTILNNVEIKKNNPFRSERK